MQREYHGDVFAIAIVSTWDKYIRDVLHHGSVDISSAWKSARNPENFEYETTSDTAILKIVGNPKNISDDSFPFHLDRRIRPGNPRYL